MIIWAFYCSWCISKQDWPCSCKDIIQTNNKTWQQIKLPTPEGHLGGPMPSLISRLFWISAYRLTLFLDLGLEGWLFASLEWGGTYHKYNERSLGEFKSGFGFMPKLTDSDGYILFRAQCKMKIQGSLFKNRKEEPLRELNTIFFFLLWSISCLRIFICYFILF